MFQRYLSSPTCHSYESINWRISTSVSLPVKVSEIVEETKEAAEYILNMAAKFGARYCYRYQHVFLSAHFSLCLIHKYCGLICSCTSGWIILLWMFSSQTCIGQRFQSSHRTVSWYSFTFAISTVSQSVLPKFLYHPFQVLPSCCVASFLTCCLHHYVNPFGQFPLVYVQNFLLDIVIFF
jgi:hypothetical protein